MNEGLKPSEDRSFNELGKENEAIENGLFRIAEEHEVSLKLAPTDREVVRRPLRDFFYDYCRTTEINPEAKLEITKEILEKIYAALFLTPENLRIVAEGYDQLDLSESREALQEEREYQMEHRGGVTEKAGYDDIDRANYNPMLANFLRELASKIEDEEKENQARKKHKRWAEEVRNQEEKEAFEVLRKTSVLIDEERQPTIEGLMEEVAEVYLRPDLSLSEKNTISKIERDTLKQNYREKLTPDQRRVIAKALARDEQKVHSELMVQEAEFAMHERSPEEIEAMELKRREYRKLVLLLKIANKLS